MAVIILCVSFVEGGIKFLFPFYPIGNCHILFGTLATMQISNSIINLTLRAFHLLVAQLLNLQKLLAHFYFLSVFFYG